MIANYNSNSNAFIKNTPHIFFRQRPGLTYGIDIPYYYIHMFRSRLRIVSLITLIALFTVLSGIVSTASALLSTAAVDVCCDVDTQQDSEKKSPCTTPDCICTFCVTAVILSDIPAVELKTTPILSHLTMPHRYHLQEHPNTIDYPPETV